MVLNRHFSIFLIVCDNDRLRHYFLAKPRFYSGTKMGFQHSNWMSQRTACLIDDSWWHEQTSRRACRKEPEPPQACTPEIEKALLSHGGCPGSPNQCVRSMSGLFVRSMSDSNQFKSPHPSLAGKIVEFCHVNT